MDFDKHYIQYISHMLFLCVICLYVSDQYWQNITEFVDQSLQGRGIWLLRGYSAKDLVRSLAHHFSYSFSINLLANLP